MNFNHLLIFHKVAEMQHFTRAVLEHALAERGLEQALTIGMELGSTEAIKLAVAAGLGISFISEHTLHLELATGRLSQLALSDFMLRRSLNITYVAEKRLSRAAHVFLELIRKSRL